MQLLQLSQQMPCGSSDDKYKRAEILPVIRKIEASILENEVLRRQFAIAYWSAADVSWLLPPRPQLLSLSQGAQACSAFAEHRQGKIEEFAFIAASKELCVLVYGHADGGAYGPEAAHYQDPSYQCMISFDQNLLKQVYEKLYFYWEFVDPYEADRLDRSLRKLGALESLPQYVDALAAAWSGIKNPLPATKQLPADTLEENKSKAKTKRSLAKVTLPEASRDKTLQERIACDYPYPIANPYRTLECITEPAEKYKEQLRLVENLLALLAGMSLAITAHHDPGIVAALKPCLISGVSTGHWRELIRKCTVVWKGSPAKDIPLARALSELRVELVERDFGKAIEQLVRARNDFAHHRGPSAESQIEKESKRIGGLLQVAVEQTAFLCDYPMRIVRAIDVLPSGSIKMTCLKATGDHPALRQEELCLNRGYPKGQLIVNLGDSNWLSLYPFLSQDICPKCGSMEIYLLDKWKFDKNTVYLRSFERGHTQESQTISDSLKALGNKA